MGGIGTGGLGNLQRALRAGLQWQVGTGVSTTSIPAVDGTGDAASFASGQWTGAYIFWLPGSTNAGAFTPITGNSASALTVSAMGTEAAEGDAFLLFAGPPGAITGLGGNLPQDGAADPATMYLLLVGGTDGTDTWAIRLDSNHYQLVTQGGSNILMPTDMQSIYRPQVVLTTTALAGSGTYTSSSINLIANPGGARRINGKVYSDQGGTLVINQSDDGTTWDQTQSLDVTGGVPSAFDVEAYAGYAELVYTNGATAQTTFRLSAYLSPV